MSIRLSVALLLSVIALPALGAGASCDRALISGGFGVPVDYNAKSDVDRARIALVEQYHFSPDVEALLKGQSSTIPSDLDYTLRQIPNHYRALDAMGRWQLKAPSSNSEKDFSNIVCYFERAFSFYPNDPMLHFVYGIYLHRKKELAEALQSYAKAEQLGLASAEFYYNLGLVHVDMGDRVNATRYAEKAYGLGYKLPGLNIKLKNMPQDELKPK